MQQSSYRNPKRTRGDIKGYIFPKLPKLDLTADAEYVANLANVKIRLKACNGAVYYMDMLAM